MKKFISGFIIALIGAFFIGALAGYSTKVFFEQGGDRLWVESGGALELASGGVQNATGDINVRSGGSINFKSGAKLRIESGMVQDVTGTVNYRSGAISRYQSGTELNLESGATQNTTGTIQLRSGGITRVQSGGEIDIESGGVQNVTGTQRIRSGGAINFESGSNLRQESGMIANATGKTWMRTGAELNLESGSTQNVTGTLDIKTGATLIKDSSQINFYQLVAGTVSPPTDSIYIPLTGMTTNDFALVQVASPVTATPHLIAASPHADQLQLVFDGPPTTGMKFNAMILHH